MAKTSSRDKQQPEGWNEGIARLTEAARHNMTATNLAYAGAVALGAAAFAYFWDEGRRNAFLEGSRKWTEDLMASWNASAPMAPLVAPSVNQ
jgi:hypothetical protein